MAETAHHIPESRLPTENGQPVQESEFARFPWDDAPLSPSAVGPAHRHQDPSVPDMGRQRAPRSAKAHLFVTVCHWGMVILLILNLLSGMRLGWGYLESPLGGSTGVWGGLLGVIAPKGTMFGVNLITLHVTLAFLMLLVSGVYVGYLLRSHTTRRLRVTRQDLHKLWAGLRKGNFWQNKPALWSANLLVYWLSFLFIAVLVITGVALYRLDWGLSTVLGGYDLMRLLHGLVAYLLVPYIFLHMVLQWFFGRFWTIFKAHLFRPHVRAGLLSLALTLPVIAGLYVWNALPTTLTVRRIPSHFQGPILDGDPQDLIWSLAQAVTIRTVKGVNNPHDHVDVEIKALHDGEQAYFLFQWRDPDASYKRFPLFKTEQGWKVLQTAFAAADENVYYEDKLSIYITDVPNGSCAATCHIGVGPHSDRGEKHGVHYTKGEVGDVWHWKSVRTNPMGLLTGDPGFMDDQHFRGPDPLVPGAVQKRYTAGYHADPNAGGGYSYNFTKLEPTKTLAETYVRPMMLPATLDIVPNPDPATSEHDATWWIHKEQGIPYTAETDTYPVGTLIPNILIAPFEGDRAHVRAQATWHQERWSLEVRRVLDTKSDFDVAFVPGAPVYITVATYNRTQTRHGEHIKPIRLVLQP